MNPYYKKLKSKSKKCLICGKKLVSYQHNFCSKKCHGKHRKGKKHSPLTISKIKSKKKGALNPQWKGGRRIHKQGYIWIHSPEHPSRDSRGYVFEHRLVMEKHLERFLKKEEKVHHIDNNPQNNSISNLMLFPNLRTHTLFHRKMEKKNGNFRKQNKIIS